MNFESFKVSDVSTAHLPEEFRDAAAWESIGQVAMDTDYGVWVYVGWAGPDHTNEDVDRHIDSLIDVPQSVVDILRAAGAQGYRYICFDSDAYEIDGVATFND